MKHLMIIAIAASLGACANVQGYVVDKVKGQGVTQDYVNGERVNIAFKAKTIFNTFDQVEDHLNKVAMEHCTTGVKASRFFSEDKTSVSTTPVSCIPDYATGGQMCSGGNTSSSTKTFVKLAFTCK